MALLPTHTHETKSNKKLWPLKSFFLNGPLAIDTVCARLQLIIMTEKKFTYNWKTRYMYYMLGSAYTEIINCKRAMSVGISQSLLSDKSVNINKRKAQRRKKNQQIHTAEKEKVLAIHLCGFGRN